MNLSHPGLWSKNLSHKNKNKNETTIKTATTKKGMA
jgi:hypothetical protein